MKLSTQLKKLSTFNFQLATSKGFTLIELLVVIAIIGILAAALIATIDPLEQIKKSQDTTTKNVAVEYLNAQTRYYATHQAFPWYPAPDGVGCTEPDGNTTIASLSTCTQALLDDNELKKGFTTSQAITKIKVGYTASDNSLRVCFKPDSKSQINDKLTKYTDANDTSGGCTVGSGACYWCTQ